MGRAISPEEVALHNSEKDCWIIIHNKVYEVTRYLNDHPGGVEIVTDLAGKDATADYDGVGHTQEAHEILERFYIGDLVLGAPMSDGKPAPAIASTPAKPATSVAPSAPVISKPAASVSTSTQPKVNKPKQEEDSTMTMIAGFAAAAIAVGIFLYRKSGKA